MELENGTWAGKLPTSWVFRGCTGLTDRKEKAEENTSTLIRNMDIKKGEVIADIGAGSGYHVFKMATLVH